jgi:hypothetical protein
MEKDKKINIIILMQFLEQIFIEKKLKMNQ